MSASPGMARATLEAAFRIDVRPILPTITVPTLVLHARDDPVVPVQWGRYLADHIPGARMVELDGADHAPWFTDPDRIMTEIEEFLTGSHAAPSQSHRALRTVLFTDMVASTQHAAATGDERWRAVLHRFGEITAELTQRFGGTVVKSTGDGHLITFDGPTQAIRCAEALRDDAENTGHRDPHRHPHRRVRTAGRRHRRNRRPHRGANPRSGRRGGNPRLPHRARPGRRLGHRLRGPRQRRVARRARHLAAAGGRSPGAQAGRPRRNWRQRRPPALAPRCAGRTAPWR